MRVEPFDYVIAGILTGSIIAGIAMDRIDIRTLAPALFTGYYYGKIIWGRR